MNNTKQEHHGNRRVAFIACVSMFFISLVTFFVVWSPPLSEEANAAVGVILMIYGFMGFLISAQIGIETLVFCTICFHQEFRVRAIGRFIAVLIVLALVVYFLFVTPPKIEEKDADLPWLTQLQYVWTGLSSTFVIGAMAGYCLYYIPQFLGDKKQ